VTAIWSSFNNVGNEFYKHFHTYEWYNTQAGQWQTWGSWVRNGLGETGLTLGRIARIKRGRGYAENLPKRGRSQCIRYIFVSASR